MRFPTMWYVRPAKPLISLRIRAVWSEPLLVAWVFYDCSATDWTPFGVYTLKKRLQRLVGVLHLSKCHIVRNHMPRLIINNVPIRFKILCMMRMKWSAFVCLQGFTVSIIVSCLVFFKRLFLKVSWLDLQWFWHFLVILTYILVGYLLVMDITVLRHTVLLQLVGTCILMKHHTYQEYFNEIFTCFF